MSQNAIVIEELTKRFDGFVAVDSISFTVRKGELFGLLGPNGAGKTTTISMLTTLLMPTSGYASVAGFDVMTQRDEVRAHIGVVFQEPALDDQLTGRENLEFHAMMYGMRGRERVERIEEVLELVELSERADVLVERYSGGMKRRLEIARGLIHRPDVLFLDEPTLGLDAQTRRRVWDYILLMKEEYGITIMLTTHYMEEADCLCDRVAIIDEGKVVALDTPERLKDTMGEDVIALEVDGDGHALVQMLQSVPWVESVSVREHTLELGVHVGERRIVELVDIVHRAGGSIRSISMHEPSLEDVFIHLTGRAIREEEASTRRMMWRHMR